MNTAVNHERVAPSEVRMNFTHEEAIAIMEAWQFCSACEVFHMGGEATPWERRVANAQREDHLKNGTRPEPWQVYHWYKRSFERLEEVYGRLTSEDVTLFWTDLHTLWETEETPVFLVTIANHPSAHPGIVEPGLMWRTWFYNPKKKDFEMRILHNAHRLELDDGYEVWIHGNVIARRV